jgi:leucine dehydrogenase
VICGAANNQLADEAKHGKIVMEKGILYAPDYVVNAGGLINVYSEVAGFGTEYAMKQAENIFATTASIFALSKKENIPTYLAANKTAEKRLAGIAHIRTRR